MNNIIIQGTEEITSTDISSEVEKYASLIDTYGVSAIILGIFIVILFILVFYIMKTTQKTNNQIMQQQELLLNKLVESKKSIEKAVSNEEEQKKEYNLVDTFLSINKSLKDILHKVLEELDASRVSVYVFHNGSFSSHGLPFFKTSCVSEVIRKNDGVSKQIHTHTGLPLEMFDSCISILRKTGKVVITNLEEKEYDCPVIVGMMRNNNIKSGIGIAIYDDDNNITGAFIAEFSEEKESLDEIEKKLIEEVQYLSPILEYNKIMKE